METSEERTEVETEAPSTEAPRKDDKPALVIVVKSWATPVAGLIMLVIGLVGGYFGRPLISASSSNAVSESGPTPTAVATADPTAVASRRAVSEAVIARTRHFKGDPNAPITIIEFSDFQ